MTLGGVQNVKNQKKLTTLNRYVMTNVKLLQEEANIIDQMLKIQIFRQLFAIFEDFPIKTY